MIQNIPYTDAPDIGYPGQITDVGQPFKTRNSVAQEQLDVGIAVTKGLDIDITTNSQSYFGFRVKRPSLISDPILGMTVRIHELEVDPPNDKDGVPVYRQDELVTILEKGSIYVTAVKAIPAARNPVYVVFQGGTYPNGTLVPDDLTVPNALGPIPGWYFERRTLINNIVRVVLG